MRMGGRGRLGTSPRKNPKSMGPSNAYRSYPTTQCTWLEDLILTYSIIKAPNIELPRAQAVGYTAPPPPTNRADGR